MVVQESPKLLAVVRFHHDSPKKFYDAMSERLGGSLQNFLGWFNSIYTFLRAIY